MTRQPNQSKKLASSILNYFAAFTETRFNFRTLINYRWTDNELTLDLFIFQDFQDQLISRIRSGDRSSISIKSNEHVVKLSGEKVFLGVSKELSGRFGPDYLKSCVEGEFKKVADKNNVLVYGQGGLSPAEGADLLPLEIEKQNHLAFLEGCRKYNLALRRQIEHILIDLQQHEIARLKDRTGLEHVPASTFNASNFLKRHFDALQTQARESKGVEEYFGKVKEYFSNSIKDIVLYDLFISLQQYARYNVAGTTYLFFHELHRKSENGSSEGYPVFFIEATLVPEINEVKVSFPRDLVLINTPAVNYFKFPSVLTTSRASTLKDAGGNLAGMEIFLLTQYGIDKPFVFESSFGTIKPPETSFPDIRCRIGFQVVRDENKKLLDYSEIMSRLQARMEQILNEKLNLPSLKNKHDLAVWFVGDVQGEERDLVYYSLVEDEKYGSALLATIYPVIDGKADTIRSLKMQRLNVGFSRAKDTMVFVHSMPLEKYAKTRLGDALKHYDKILAESQKGDFFVEDPSVFDSPAEKDLYALLVNTEFVKANREHVRIIPQFKIGEYLQAEFARQIPKYRVDFLMTFSKGGKEQTLILEYDGVEYHTKTPDIVTKHNFSQEYLDYDIRRQIELESYGYRFLRLNKFNLQPGQAGETKMDVLDRFLRKAFAVE